MKQSGETGRHLQGYGVSSPSCGGHGKRVQLTAQSPGFMRRRVGVMSGKPVQQEVFVSHNSLQLLLQVVCDLQAVLVNQAAAASTSAIPAAVIFVFVLVGCFGWRSLPAQSLSPLECWIFCNVCQVKVGCPCCGRLSSRTFTFIVKLFPF